MSKFLDYITGISTATGRKKIQTVKQDLISAVGTEAGEKLPLALTALDTSFTLFQEDITKMNVFSFRHSVISPNGMYNRISNGEIEYYHGIGIDNTKPSDPLKQSLGSDVVLDQPNSATSLARLTQNNGLTAAGIGNEAVESNTYLYKNISHSTRYGLLSSYKTKGLDGIQFTNTAMEALNGQEATNYYGGSFGKKKGQYALLYGNTTAGIVGLGANEQTYDKRFSKLKLGFLSMFLGLNEKKEGFAYNYPIYDPSDPFYSNFGPVSLSKSNKLLKTLGASSQFGFDRIIDDPSDSFLQTIINDEGNEYKRHLYSIGYQVLVGQEKSELPGLQFYSPGIEKNTYYHARLDSRIPLSEEVAPILAGGNALFPSDLIADIKPKYNYTIPFYEEALDLIPEIRIPNIYNMILKDGVENPGASYLAPVDVDGESDPNTGNYELSLFENIANSFINCNETEEDVYKNPKYTSFMNIVVDDNLFKNGAQGSLLNSVEDLKDKLPMYVEVSFNREQRSDEDQKLLNVLSNTFVIKHYIQSFIKHSGPLSNTDAIIKEKTGEEALSEAKLENLVESFNFFTATGLFTPYTFNTVTDLRDSDELQLFDTDSVYTVLPDSLTCDFGEWLKLYMVAASENKDNQNQNMLVKDSDTGVVVSALFDKLNEGQYSMGGLATYLMDEKSDFVAEDDYPSSIISQTYAISANFKSYVEKAMPEFSRINSEMPCKSVTLFYEIKKYDEDGNNIQNIFVQNNDNSRVTYIDTQVKYGKKYQYEIIAHKLTIGADYKFKFENTITTDRIAKDLGYEKKLQLDIVYSALKNGPVGPKVADYFNFPYSTSGIVEGQTDPTNPNLVSLSAPPGYDLGENDSIFFDIDQGGTTTDTSLLGIYTDKSISTYRAYTKTRELSPNKPAFIPGTMKAPPQSPGDHQLKVDTATKVKANPAVENPHPGPGGVVSPDGEENPLLDTSPPLVDGACEVVDDLSGTNLDDEKLFIVKVESFPKPIIAKVPYFKEFLVEIVDLPPIFPNVNFYPYAKNRNKLLITFENQTGDVQDIPVVLSSQDQVIFDNIRASQKRMYQNSNGEYFYPQLRFKSDDFASEYQVFRLKNYKPTSYDDFYGSAYKNLNVSFETAFEESLQTNAKYYYTFRTVDTHNNLSNPSPVYEVEMVEDGGLVYPVISVIDLKPELNYNKTKDFKRFLKIDASYGQKLLNNKESNIYDDGTFKDNFKPSLSVMNKTIWNDKKFKFRIKAKNSCKVIEFNVNFITKHTDNDDGSKSCN